MTTATAECQAYRLSEVLAALDGAVTDAAELTCDEPTSCAVFIRRPGWAMHVSVCEPHRVVISLGVVGYVRST